MERSQTRSPKTVSPCDPCFLRNEKPTCVSWTVKLNYTKEGMLSTVLSLEEQYFSRPRA